MKAEELDRLFDEGKEDVLEYFDLSTAKRPGLEKTTRIIDSFHFYEIAVENYERAEKGFKIHRQNDAIVAIVFSALALEAFINEILYLVEDAQNDGQNEDFFQELIEAIKETGSQRKNTQEKFFLASKALGNPFNKGENPYQDFADLFRVRDCLVHLKPEDIMKINGEGVDEYIGRELCARLRNKNIFNNYTEIQSITLLLSTAKAAKWACETTAKMVNCFLNKIPPESKFYKNNEVLSLYRNLFC